MSVSMPSKAEQIEALIGNSVIMLAKKYASYSESGKLDFAKIFNVTRIEIKNYLKSNYTLASLPGVHSTVGQEDGIYIIFLGNSYEMYFIERGVKFAWGKANSEDGAWELYIKFILTTNVTNLKWE